MILIAILLAGLIYIIRSGIQENLVSYLITLLAGFIIPYNFIPLKPADNAFKFLIKNFHFFIKPLMKTFIYLIEESHYLFPLQQYIRHYRHLYNIQLD